MPLEDSPYVKGMRRRTLNSLSDPIRIDPEAINNWDPVTSRPIQIDPNTVNNWQPPAPKPAAPRAWQTPPEPGTQQPWQPPPPPPDIKPDTSFDPLKDLGLGAQTGLTGLSQMIYKPTASIYGGKLVPITQSMAEQLSPDPATLASRSSPLQRTTQFIGRLPADIARYGLAAAVAGGNPILGAAGAEALSADTPQQALVQGAIGGLGGAAMEYGLPLIGKYVSQTAQRAASLPPSQEELAADLLERGAIGGKSITPNVSQAEADRAGTFNLGRLKQGEPGISMETDPILYRLRRMVYRDQAGSPKGYLHFYLDNELRDVAPPEHGLYPEVFVDPGARRQGIATQLYDAAAEAGYDLSRVSGTETSPSGAAFLNARTQPR